MQMLCVAAYPSQKSPCFSRPGLLYISLSSYHCIMQATFRLLCISDAPTLTLVLGPTHVYASTTHSYHTRASSVCRHMLISSSESWGK